MPHLIPPFIRNFSPHTCRLAGCLLLIGTVMLPQAKGESGLWTGTGPINEGRVKHTATLIADGKVLVAGGESNGRAVVSSELYDPATGLWTSTGSMAQVRYGHTATLLANGKVLVAGGSDGNAMVSLELYDPATGLWTSTGSMGQARYNHTATLLTNGKVLVAGGDDGKGSLTSSRLYDPATGLWTSTGSMVQGCYDHTAILLANGKVLVAGGRTSSSNGSSTSASPELYDPTTGLWASTNPMIQVREDPTFTLLVNGKVLVAGGEFNGFSTPTSSQLYDPATGLWTSTGSMIQGSYNHTATLLANGKVLVAGGLNSNGAVTSSELYASDRVSGDYFYLVVNGAAIISGYRGAGGNVNIPATLDGLPVTGIDNNAFYGNSSIVALAIPASIASIGNQAFFGCTGLTSIQLPEKFLTDIEYIGLSGQIAATTLIQGVADNLSRSNPFISDFTKAVLSETGNYGLATKTDLYGAVDLLATKAELNAWGATLASKTELSESMAPLASKADLAAGMATLASKTELSDSIAPLASKDELAIQSAALLSQLNALATNPDFVAALAKNQTFLAALASQVLEGPNNYGLAIKQNQSLSFPAFSPRTYTPRATTLPLAVTSSSRLTPMIYTSSNTSVASISGSVLSILQAGTTVITATQVGNATINSAVAAQTLTIKKITQTLNFRAIAAQTYAMNKSFPLAVTSSAGLIPVIYSSSNTAVATVSGNVVILQGKGSTTISATQDGNVNYTPAMAAQILVVR